MEEKQLNPEAQKRLERYNQALLQEDGTVEHELATYMDAFFEGYNGPPHPPYLEIGSEDDITSILEQNDTYDTLEDALYDYYKAHEDMSKKDYDALAKVADSMAFYAYQNYLDPQELVASYIQHIQLKLEPEAQRRLEQYNAALLREDGSVEHELATYMDAMLQGHKGKPNPPYHPITGEEECMALADSCGCDDDFDVLADALNDYVKAHPDMHAADYARLAKAADSLAFYEYQVHAPIKGYMYDPYELSANMSPEECIERKIQLLKEQHPDANVLKEAILKNIQEIIQSTDASEEAIEKALRNVRKEILDLPKAKQPSR